ncbi:MAG TPA: LysE family transporter [Candidatus Nanoarchaeia archaeon]|nr:LysE family transporter [Candidatus Nanoarchaeia archaeon]
MRKNLKIFIDGLTIGLFLQLAIGPIFFFIINLTLQRTIYDGLIAVLAVTMVDYFYITLSIIGIGKLLEKKKIKNIFGTISSLVLMIFGVIIIKNIIENGLSATVNLNSVNLLSSFLSVFILTISSPMTILFFIGIFTAKAIEYNYTKKELYIFGFSVGLATFIFMGLSVILFSLFKENIPLTLIQGLNLLVGFVLIGYGLVRIIKILKQKKQMIFK